MVGVNPKVCGWKIDSEYGPCPQILDHGSTFRTSWRKRLDLRVLVLEDVLGKRVGDQAGSM